MTRRILLVLVPFLLCGLGLMWVRGGSPRAPGVTNVPWEQYPSTSSQPEVPSSRLRSTLERNRNPQAVDPSGVPQFRPQTHYLDRYGRVQPAGYDDTIHPDEDLLQPNGAVSTTPTQSATTPQSTDQPPPSTPTTDTPPASQEGIRPAPQASHGSPQQIDAVTPAQPPTVPPNGQPVSDQQSNRPNYDPNQPPGSDENLLQEPQARPGQNLTPSSPPPDDTSPDVPPAPQGRPNVAPGPAADPQPNQAEPMPQDAGAGSSVDSSPEELPVPEPGVTQPTPGQTPHASPSEIGAPPTAPPSYSSDDIVVEPQHVPGDSPLHQAPHGAMTTPPSQPGVDPHAEVFADTMFPSATKCKACHEQIYEEWASSSHAYAAISPMFQKFEQTINTLTRGTIGYFCMRCHAPVATWLGHPRHYPVYDSIPSAKEGVTCVACHRVREAYGKVNGERRMEPGPVTDPVYGAGYGEGLAEVLAKKDYYKIKSPGEPGPGQQIHQQVIHFEQISSSHFCAPCHQVAVAPGIALEVVWAQYRASPAHKQGITCQECHMGREPGVAAGYDYGPVAVVNGKPVSPHRRHSNHLFYGPGYSIAHPGTFPFVPEQDDWTIDEWLEFDYRAGWGTDEFEDKVADGIIQCQFPETWENVDDRYDARDIVDANLKKLEAKRHMRHRLMENGSHIEGPVFKRQPQRGKSLRFHYVVENLNIGHNMPSGSLGAQPQLWLNVVLTGPNGQRLWESGYVDSLGDVADLHSLDVAAKRIRPDQQLFNLQTKFLITNVKGTDREMYLPVPTDLDQLPFIRPSAFPITVMNHPPFIRMEAHSIPATGQRQAKYHVPGHLMSSPGVYRLSVRMRSRAEPIYFMRYCRATPEMERNMNEWMLNFHEQTFEFYVP